MVCFDSDVAARGRRGCGIHEAPPQAMFPVALIFPEDEFTAFFEPSGRCVIII